MSSTKLIEEEPPKELRYKFKVEIDLESSENAKALIPYLEKCYDEIEQNCESYSWIHNLIKIIKREK